MEYSELWDISRKVWVRNIQSRQISLHIYVHINTYYNDKIKILNVFVYKFRVTEEAKNSFLMKIIEETRAIFRVFIFLFNPQMIEDRNESRENSRETWLTPLLQSQEADLWNHKAEEEQTLKTPHIWRERSSTALEHDSKVGIKTHHAPGLEFMSPAKGWLCPTLFHLSM